MINNRISEDLLALLALIDEFGSSVCVGTCEHRKPGELHCLNISQRLKISTTGVKNRLRKLVSMGYLKRERVKRGDGKVMGEYTLSEEGLQLIRQSDVQ